MGTLHRGIDKAIWEIPKVMPDLRKQENEWFNEECEEKKEQVQAVWKTWLKVQKKNGRNSTPMQKVMEENKIHYYYLL